MRVLHYYNWGYFEPISCGADVVASNQLEYCRRRGWDVDILVMAHADRAHQADDFRRRYSWARSIQAVEVPSSEFTFRGQVVSHQHVARSDVFRDLARQGHDLLFTNYVFSAPLIEPMPRDCLKLLQANDIITDSFALNERTQDPRRDPLAAARDAFLWDLELELFDLFDGLIFINEQESRLVERSCPGRTHAVYPMMPWEVESESGAGGPAEVRPTLAPPDPEPFDLIFVGSNAGPNVRAITAFYDDIFVPYLRKHRIRMAIIGKVCDQIDFSDWYVTPMGVVSGDLRQYYERTKLVVIPLQEGSGLSIKTIECLASGRAVATTPVGARGLKHDPEAYLQLDMAGDPRKAAEAILELLSSDARRAQMQRRAREYYRRNFGRDRYFEAMDRVMESLRIAS